MAYELTGAAAGTGNPYLIVGAAIIDTIRATAKQTTTQKGSGLQQNQLSAENFSSYVTDAIGQSGLGGGAGNRIGKDSSVFSEALTKRGAGNYALTTAPTITADNSSQTTKRSIICTTLAELGELHPVVYNAGLIHWAARNPRMISGYHKWGYYVADLCRRNLLVRKICGFIARSRYLYILFDDWNFIGWATVKIGEPICYAIGDSVSRGDRNAVSKY